MIKSQNARLPNTAEANNEKHLLTVTIEDRATHINTGSVDHPMVDAHDIEWIHVKTQNSSQRKYLNPGKAPFAMTRLLSRTPAAISTVCGRRSYSFI